VPSGTPRVAAANHRQHPLPAIPTDLAHKGNDFVGVLDHAGPVAGCVLALPSDVNRLDYPGRNSEVNTAARRSTCAVGPPKKPLRSSELRAAFLCSPKPPPPPGRKKELKMPRHT
jgi:hypothetical protein